MNIHDMLEAESLCFCDDDPVSIVVESCLAAKDVLIEVNEMVADIEVVSSIYEETKRNPVATEGLFEVDLNLKDPLANLKRTLQIIGMKIGNAIKDLFRSILNFFQSTICRRDVQILKKDFWCIEKYYSDLSQPAIMCNLTVYMSKNPFEMYTEDSETIRRIMPVISDAIVKLTDDIRHTQLNFAQQIPYAFGKDKEDSHIKVLRNELFDKILPKKINRELLNDQTITAEVRSKYFGETKETAEQSIKDVITSKDFYAKIVSNEAFEVFKKMRTECDACLSKAMTEVDNFGLDSYKSHDKSFSPNWYGKIRNRVLSYKVLLSIMLRMSMLYWELYSTFRKDAVNAAQAIIRTYKTDRA